MKTLIAVSLIAVSALLASGCTRAEAAPPTGAALHAMENAALGAAKWQATLATDGGSTGVTQVKCFTTPAGGVAINNTVLLRPMSVAAATNGPDFCYKTCLAGVACVPDCTKDLIVNRPRAGVSIADAGVYGFTNLNAPDLIEPIEMATDTCIAALSADGGAIQVKVFTLTKNPK